MTPSASDLWFMPLSGCGEIGMNMSLYGHDGRWLMVDCGIGFDRNSADTRIITAMQGFIVARRDHLDALLVTHAANAEIRTAAERHAARACPSFSGMAWAQRLKRVFNIEIEVCSRCGGSVRVIASIEDQAVIDRILTHLRQKEQ